MEGNDTRNVSSIDRNVFAGPKHRAPSSSYVRSFTAFASDDCRNKTFPERSTRYVSPCCGPFYIVLEEQSRSGIMNPTRRMNLGDCRQVVTFPSCCDMLTTRLVVATYRDFLFGLACIAEPAQNRMDPLNFECLLIEDNFLLTYLHPARGIRCIGLEIFRCIAACTSRVTVRPSHPLHSGCGIDREYRNEDREQRARVYSDTERRAQTPYPNES